MSIDVTAAVDRALELGELGFQVAVYEGEDLIVDVCAGFVDEDRSRLVDDDTIFHVCSVTKALTATAVNLQVERGLLDCDAPIAEYWPEFAANGKAAITVRQVLTHESGLPQMPADITPELLGDWEWIIEHIAALEPLFEAGSASSYQAYNFGWILGEVIRRTDSKSRLTGDFFRDEICAPLGIEDIWMGLPPEQDHRVAPVTRGGTEPDRYASEGDLLYAALPHAIFPTPELWNREDFRRACIPAGGGIMTARAQARVFALLANRGELGGTRLLSEELVQSFTVPREGSDRFDVDRVIGVAPPIGSGGYWLGGSLGAGPTMICHEGYGGSYAMADLDSGIALSICHNRWFPATLTPLALHPFAAVMDTIRAARPDLNIYSLMA